MDEREATLARELPRSLLVLGGGPTGCELAQVYARFGVPVTIVQSGPAARRRRTIRGTPRRSAARSSATASRCGPACGRCGRMAGAGADGAHVIDLDDGTTAEGHAVLLAVGRDFPLDDLGLEHYGVDTTGRTPSRATAGCGSPTGLWVIGDPAGPELHTHQAPLPGRARRRGWRSARTSTPDYRALPRATYTDPEAAFVGRGARAGARGAGLDAFEFVADFPKTAKGYSVEAETGHVTIVVDRGSHELVGAAMACPDASAAIHECVLAIKARVQVEVLAETIHAFPSTSRIFNGLFADAAKQLASPPRRRG